MKDGTRLRLDLDGLDVQSFSTVTPPDAGVDSEISVRVTLPLVGCPTLRASYCHCTFTFECPTCGGEESVCEVCWA